MNTLNIQGRGEKLVVQRSYEKGWLFDQAETVAVLGMVLVKLSGKDGELTLAAARALASAAKEENKHKKARETAREIIVRELLEKRDLNIDALPAQEIVVVQCDGSDVLKIERKSSQRFDEKGFSLMHPDLAASFNKPRPATYIDALVK